MLHSGSADMFIRVFQHGKVVHRANFGYRDVEHRIPSDSDIEYAIIESLTKAMIAAAFDIPAEDDKLT